MTQVSVFQTNPDLQHLPCFSWYGDGTSAPGAHPLEDVDLSLRIRRFGQSVKFIPESKIWHKISTSVGGEYSFIKLLKIFRYILKQNDVVKFHLDYKKFSL